MFLPRCLIWNQRFKAGQWWNYGNAKCREYSYTLDDDHQYMQLCQEEKCEPLNRTTLFKILDVREASQRKSLQGLDNTVAGGSAAFQTVEMISDSLEKAGLEKKWCIKRYLKTDYRVHCNQRKLPVPTTAANLPSVTNKIPIFKNSVLISTQKLAVTVKIWKMLLMK